MNLYQHIEKCLDIARDLKAKGIDTEEIELIGIHGASGAPYEIGNAFLQNVESPGHETIVEEYIDIKPEAQGHYVEFYLGN